MLHGPPTRFSLGLFTICPNTAENHFCPAVSDAVSNTSSAKGQNRRPGLISNSFSNRELNCYIRISHYYNPNSLLVRTFQSRHSLKKKKGEYDHKKMLFLGHIRGSALGWSTRTERARLAKQMIIETHITNSSGWRPKVTRPSGRSSSRFEGNVIIADLQESYVNKFWIRFKILSKC